MLSLRYKILLLTIVPLALVLIFIGVLTINNKLNTEKTVLLERLSTYRTFIESGDISFETSADKIKLEALFNEKVEFSEIIGKNYEVMYSSENSTTPFMTAEDKTEIDDAFNGIETAKNIAASNGKKAAFVIISPLIVNNKVVAVLHQGISNEKSSQRIKAYMLYIILSIFGGIITCIVLISILSDKIILKNIYNLKNATLEIQKGNLDKKIELNTNDEIGELAETFNQMTIELKKSKEHLEKYNYNLEHEVDERTKELNRKVLELEKSEKKFHDIALSSGDFIWELDKDWKYVSATGSVKEILGYTPEEIIGKSPFDIMATENMEHVGEFFKDISMKKSPIVNLEIWNKTKDGRKICLLINGVPVFDEKGDLLGYRGVDKEITDRKKYEEELTKWEDELAYKDKQLVETNKKVEEANVKLRGLDMQKDEFISLAAHELKTPLTSIRGFAQVLLEKDKWGDEENRHYLDMINRNTDRLYNLVTDIVDSSRINLGKLKFNIEPHDVYEIFDEIKEDMNLIISKKGLMPEFSIEDGLPKVHADFERTMQILRNLISNSMKFTEQGVISLHVNRDGEYIQFTVKDTGQGIPDENKSALFSRFYQVDSSMTRKTGGSGLGLSVCKGLVEGMGGKIGFESEAGKGSTFHFTLPIYHDGNN